MARSTWALSASALFFFASHLAAAAPAAPGSARPAELPRYRFEVGQEFTYKTSSEFKYGSASQQKGKADKKPAMQNSFGDHTDWKVWVVRKNDDGSYRLLLRSAESRNFNGRESGRSNSTLAYCDITTDGRLITNPTLGYQMQPATLFPRLPADEREVRNGWTDSNKQDATTYNFEVISQPTTAAGVWTIREVRKTSLDEIYLSTHKSTLTFDPKLGLVTKFESESTQGYGINGKGTGMGEFVSAEKHDAVSTSKLWAQADHYFTANREYEEKTKQASKNSDASKKLLEQAKAILDAAQKVATLPVVKEQLDDQIKQHTQMASYYVDEATRRAKMVGHPAAPFTADDLKGKPHALKDYQGRVVVMDFWYRGCGWCMRAIPQMKQLEEDFRDQPVTFLGMNTDRNEADAKFVIDKMGLTYTTLKAKGLPEKYGVRGFPTLVIIDKEGKIQDLYVGYSHELRQEVGDIVRGLLAKK
jgi:thiol-disulfide isomerase/thioredoxin